jgi:hypothetical protein
MPVGIQRIAGSEAKRVWGESSGLAIGCDLQRRPEPEQALLLEKFDLTLPQQPPPKIYASQLAALEGY